jgi:hypothetical protein
MGVFRHEVHGFRKAKGGKMKHKKGRDKGPEKIRVPAITMKKGSGFYVQRHDDYLVIVLPLGAPYPSSTGNTNVVGSTGGPRATFVEIDGVPAVVHAVVTLNPNCPVWRLRAYAILARWEGKLA